MDKVKAFLSKAWDWTKRVFGRSKIVAVQVFGLLSASFVELSDSISNLNLDDFFKHSVAVTIGLVVQVLTVLLRVYASNGPVSFRAKEPEIAAKIDEVDHEVGPNPKAE